LLCVISHLFLAAALAGAALAAAFGAALAFLV